MSKEREEGQFFVSILGEFSSGNKKNYFVGA